MNLRSSHRDLPFKVARCPIRNARRHAPAWRRRVLVQASSPLALGAIQLVIMLCMLGVGLASEDASASGARRPDRAGAATSAGVYVPATGAWFHRSR